MERLLKTEKEIVTAIFINSNGFLLRLPMFQISIAPTDFTFTCSSFKIATSRSSIRYSDRLLTFYRSHIKKEMER